MGASTRFLRRARSSPQNRGSKSRSLKDLRRTNGLVSTSSPKHREVRTRKVLLKSEWWLRDNGPLLAWIATDKRPVALIPISPKRYLLHDLSKKEVVHVNGRVAAQLDPTSVVFYRPLPKRSATAIEIIGAALAGCSKDLAMVIVLAVGGSLISVATTVVAANIYNGVILTHRIALLTQFACILLALTMTNVMFEITKSIATLRVESKMDAYLQAGVMDRLLSLPAPFFRRFTTGDLTERTLGVNQIREALSGAATQSILLEFSRFQMCCCCFGMIGNWRLSPS